MFMRLSVLARIAYVALVYCKSCGMSVFLTYQGEAVAARRAMFSTTCIVFKWLYAACPHAVES